MILVISDRMVVQPQLVEIVQPSTSRIDHQQSEISVIELVPKKTFDSDVSFEDIPFQRFPKALRTRLEKGQRPTATERREMVRIVVAAVMEHIPVPRKKHMEAVAMAIVKQYPLSFQDIIGKDAIGFGYSSLLCQLIARAENCRRPSGVLKTKVTEAREEPKRFADSYGCVNHQRRIRWGNV